MPSADAENFNRFAQELDRGWIWRYGFVRQHHGRFLVKARLTADAPLLVAPDADDELAQRMAHELHLRPWEAALELGFSALLWAFWSAALVPWRRQLAGENVRRWRRCAVRGLSWIAMSTAVLAPYLVAGYGEPPISSWQGRPVWSSSPLSGAALSYTLVFNGAVLWPLLTLAWTEPLLKPIGQRATMWLISVVSYGVAGAGVRWVGERWGGE